MEAKQQCYKWGGKRPNQTGRPPKAPEDRASVTLTFRVRPTDLEKITSMAKEGETRHAAARRFFLEAVKNHPSSK